MYFGRWSSWVQEEDTGPCSFFLSIKQKKKKNRGRHLSSPQLEPSLFLITANMHELKKKKKLQYPLYQITTTIGTTLKEPPLLHDRGKRKEPPLLHDEGYEI